MAKFKVLTCTDGIPECASIVKTGGVIVFPTDTIYGIGCDPHNDSSVERIFKIKGRDEKKPLPVLTYSMQDAEKIVSFGRASKMLADKYWPGALTIVAPLVDEKISRRVTSSGSNLAVRVPANLCVLALLRECRYVVGTSANISGANSSKSAQEVLNSGLDGFDVLLDGGHVGGVESTIVDMTATTPVISREGAIKSSEVLRLIAQV
jgi:L-threonylcarbamoyladenylate synthase